jgi:hypothetical protein
LAFFAGRKTGRVVAAKHRFGGDAIALADQGDFAF